MIFIASNLPTVSEITPLMIITKLEQHDDAGAHQPRGGAAVRRSFNPTDAANAG